MIKWEKIKAFCLKKDEKLEIFEFDILETLWYLKFSDRITCENSEVLEQFKANQIIYLNLRKYYNILLGQNLINENITKLIKGSTTSFSKQTGATNSISREGPHEKQDNISLSTNDSKTREKNVGETISEDAEKGLRALKDLQELIENQNVYEKIVDKLAILYKMWKFENEI